MWEAYCHGTVVITISPMEHNWAIRFLSHARYDDVDEFTLAVADGRVAEVIRSAREETQGR
jgi:hypothetical protein